MKKISENNLISFGKMFPSMLTLANGAAGMTAILLASRGMFEKAIIAIIMGAVFDLFDGRVARMFKSASDFGVQLDSLCDCITFGIAPAFVVYFFATSDIKSFGWVVAVIYGMCCVLRLARFNVMTGDKKVPSYWKDFFVGVPAPAAAMISVVPLMFYFATGLDIFKSSYLCLGVVLLSALLMISRVPTISVKKVKMAREIFPFILVLFTAVLMLFYFHFWYVMSIFWFLYIFTIPFSISQFLKLKKEM